MLRFAKLTPTPYFERHLSYERHIANACFTFENNIITLIIHNKFLSNSRSAVNRFLLKNSQQKLVSLQLWNTTVERIRCGTYTTIVRYSVQNDLTKTNNNLKLFRALNGRLYLITT